MITVWWLKNQRIFAIILENMPSEELMNDEKLKKQIGANITTYRKRLGLTQAGLAEKLNYSDKAVS